MSESHWNVRGSSDPRDLREVFGAGLPGWPQHVLPSPSLPAPGCGCAASSDVRGSFQKPHVTAEPPMGSSLNAILTRCRDIQPLRRGYVVPAGFRGRPGLCLGSPSEACRSSPSPSRAAWHGDTLGSHWGTGQGGTRMLRWPLAFQSLLWGACMEALPGSPASSTPSRPHLTALPLSSPPAAPQAPPRAAQRGQGTNKPPTALGGHRLPTFTWEASLSFQGLPGCPRWWGAAEGRGRL